MGTMKFVISSLAFLLLQVTSIVVSTQQSSDPWAEGLYEIIEYSNIGDDPSDLGRLGSKDEIIVDFMLFTRNNRDNHFNLELEDEESFLKSNFNASKDLKVIIHGWRNDFESPVGDMLKEAYLDQMDINVIVVDWSSRSFKNYAGSRLSVPKVADIVAQMIDFLVKRMGADLKRVHLIGHSLGAHVAGITGLRLNSGKIARVTGLDPAAPGFTMAEEDILKPESATFVDVIHTCGYMLGFISPLGHADFYPNKGTAAQPGCGLDLKGECSHSRSYELFAESIGSYKFLSLKCKDAAAYDENKCSPPAIPMGEHTPSTARGLFFLKTNRKSPFAKGNRYMK